jgi:flagellar protein FliJ
MRKFKFSLKAVLEHRERIEEEKQQILAARQHELKLAEDELARLNGEFKRYSTVLRDDHARLSTDELRRHYAHLEYLDRCMVMQHAVISQRRAAVERARADLVEASKDRKVIEKLKDKRFQEYQAMEAAFEQKELDDSNARRHSRMSAAMPNIQGSPS